MAKTPEGASPFDFEGFRRAFTGQDIERWLDYFADDAEWIEYRHDAPPRSPNRMSGRAAIGAFLARVKASNIALAISDEVIGETRAAFMVICTLPDGRRIIENVILHFAEGKIARQVDVEAWD